MTSYMIYITKSDEAAARIAKSFSGELWTDDILDVSHGAVNSDERIPAIYHGRGNFCCVVELRDHGENGVEYPPTYELTIC